MLNQLFIFQYALQFSLSKYIKFDILAISYKAMNIDL
ncbi:hypothetical protein HDE69_002224 [Pedobacter cryoconitis]|uniref:Uncharacterized protein n=1 Tax=Pedobacter cryoconitis TaxID=188932 RepID=A0A7W9DJG4_9SPHI|nr:hypothetical protein [Pedobacter cryoconitis]MBB5645517.1 hypothetical protein [Pedobacter cryoconitis]